MTTYIKKIRAGLVPNASVDTYVGDPGTIFYNPDVGALYLSDGVNPGGTALVTAGGSGDRLVNGASSFRMLSDGTLTFPTLTVPISDNATPSGTGQTIKFSDSSQQAIIFGPASTAETNSAQRIIIQGAPGYEGTGGEGGDIYLWAGPGGSTNGDGGDIKVRAGYGPGTGQGGYLNFQAGDSADGQGGYINIESGESSTYGSGGDITVRAQSGGEITLRTRTSNGTNNDWLFGADGSLTFPDATVQTTAWTGTVAYSNITDVPSVSTSTLVNGTSTLSLSSIGALTFPDSTVQTTAYPGYLTWSISASGSSDYVFSGPGIETGNTDDPVLYLYKGFTYKFINTTVSSHPFAIRVSNGGADYTTGVSGSQTGTQTFTVPMNAPSTLYYQCTIHSGMGNVINIV